MAATNPTLWGIHAGRAGDADHLFLTQSVIALGWGGCWGPFQTAPERETFKARLRECYPDRKEGYFRVAGGQLFRFVASLQSSIPFCFCSVIGILGRKGTRTTNFPANSRTKFTILQGTVPDPPLL